MAELYSDIMQELSDNFMAYAAAVNTDRAIPDAKSGLKPVARRILFDMYTTGKLSNKPHTKCAAIVGDTMGKYHPHGNTSIYEALVRLAQPWVMRYPLIDFHGNKGNMGGNGPAADRYTEAKLSKIAEFGMLDGIKRNVVDFIPNYSEDLEEPVTLPSLFPNLLCNPNTGIGVSLACNWLPHNLNEVVSAIQAYLENSEITIDELVAGYLPAPDFPMGATIINKDNMLSCYKTGRGRVIMQAKYDVETRAKKTLLVYKELPFGVNTETLLKQINDLVVADKIKGIEEVRDESNKNGLRIVVELSKDGNAGSVATRLYQDTDMQKNTSFNQVALVDKVPVTLNLKQAIEIYVAHQVDIIVREMTFELAKAKTKLNIVEGLLIALENIDAIIQLIKNSKSTAEARVQLGIVYKLNEAQTKAIVDMKLGRIAGLEKVEVQTEKKDLLLKIEDCTDILSSQSRQNSVLSNRLAELGKKYGDDRRSIVAQIDIAAKEKVIEAIEPEDVVVALTKAGHIKRIPVKSFKIQKRNGKGIKSKDESILDIIKTNTIDTLVMFSSLGKMYRIVVDDVPASTNAGIGTAVASLVKLAIGEEIVAITSLYRKSTSTSVVFVTANGMIKKTSLSEYASSKRTTTGVIALKLKEGDKVVEITFLADQELILISKLGMAIRVLTKDINEVGRVAMGVKGMKLTEGDEVVSAVPVHKDTDTLAIFTSKGTAKKVPLSEFAIQGRNGKGVYCYKGEIVIGAAMVSDDDNLLIIGRTSNICISAKEIPEASRTAVGSIMIKDNAITSIVKI